MNRLIKAKELVKHEPDEAMRICNEVLDEEFDSGLGQRALFMIGYIMMEVERYGLAYQIYKRCADLNPRQSEIYSNMGMCLEISQPKQALKMFERASQLSPKNAKAYANQGLIHLNEGRPQKCIELCDKAISIQPGQAAVHNKGLAQLMLRDFKEGWKNYYNTHGVKHREKRDYGYPEWDGKAKGTVLIYGEQGVGDEIMFASCYDDVMKTNDIVIDCDGRLEALFKRSFDCPVYGTRFRTDTPLIDEQKIDYQIAAGQLPHFYRNKESDFPGTSYLTPNPDKSLMWGALFDSYEGDKIGIAWNGGNDNTGRKKRSLSLDDFEPILNKGAIISLDYIPSEPKQGIKYFDGVLKGRSIDDLAAIIANLNYVVTCCTTVVYIAGALGVPCYVLVPSKPGYRYHLKGDFPWYSSVTVIRQSGTWRDTVAKNIHRFRPSRDSGVPRSLSKYSSEVFYPCQFYANKQA